VFWDYQESMAYTCRPSCVFDVWFIVRVVGFGGAAVAGWQRPGTLLPLRKIWRKGTRIGMGALSLDAYYVVWKIPATCIGFDEGGLRDLACRVSGSLFAVNVCLEVIVYGSSG